MEYLQEITQPLGSDARAMDDLRTRISMRLLDLAFETAPYQFQSVGQFLGEPGTRRFEEVRMIPSRLPGSRILMHQLLQGYVNGGQIDLAEFAHCPQENF